MSLRWGLVIAVLGIVACMPWPDRPASAQESLPTVQVSAPPHRPAPKKRTTPARVTVNPAPSTPPLSNVEQGAPSSAPVEAASEFVYSGARVNAYPVSRPGEVLEAVPGLVITQHSGEGKANQYFLRGFNLDHGTDLAIKVDGMPINMPTHGHGQGY